MNSEILVIVVTFNGMQWMERCVESVRESGADLLVIDNGSSDGTPEWLRSEGVEVISREDNPGFGAANNIGIRLSLERGYSYVYLLNQDAWLCEGCLENMLKTFNSGDAVGYGVLSPLQFDASMKKLDKNFDRKCGGSLKDAGWSRRRGGGEAVVEVPFVMAAHWMVSLFALKTVGGFSPAFRQYGEDDNWIHRLHFHGLKCGVVTGASAVHDRSTRKPTKARKMHLKCIAAVVKVSNPSCKLIGRLLLEPLELLGMGCLHFSTIPWRFIPTLIKRYPELVRLRRESRKAGAFLTNGPTR